MEKLKGLKTMLLILFGVLILVIIKTTGKNRFKQDVRHTMEAVKGNDYFVSLNDYKTSENHYFVVDLTESGSAQFKNSLKIQFKNLLDEGVLQQLKDTDKKILLYSDDFPVAVKAWVIMSQLKFKNVFVLSEEKNREVLKYELKVGASEKL